MWQLGAVADLGFTECSFEIFTTACPSNEKHKHIESGLVDYWFEDHFLLLSSPFLTMKIGILIAKPQLLNHDAQKGHGLLISSDY